mmetsp:Transcript_8117/g.17180  ORF Transcript_8117/g.17180 Transcript_8117/m.17180 type:complete len:85 (+) Transcript_8117:1755-2009(+)
MILGQLVMIERKEVQNTLFARFSRSSCFASKKNSWRLTGSMLTAFRSNPKSMNDNLCLSNLKTTLLPESQAQVLFARHTTDDTL